MDCTWTRPEHWPELQNMLVYAVRMQSPKSSVVLCSCGSDLFFVFASSFFLLSSSFFFFFFFFLILLL